MAKRRPSKLKIVDRKLGRESADGQCFNHGKLIEIDPRQTPRNYLATLVHELLHQAYRDKLSEREVIHGTTVLTRYIWAKNYRRVNQ